MRLYRIIIILTLILCSRQHAWCQESKEYLYVDSNLLNPPDVVDTVLAEQPATAEDEMGAEAQDDYEEKRIYVLDTNLVNNELSLSNDSILALKNSKQFAYARSMDSLLKALQKEQMENQQQAKPDSPSALEKIFSSGITKVIFWGLAVFFVLFIIGKLFITQGFFQRNTTRAPVNVQAENETGPEDPQDFERKAAEAAAGGNYRLATRYLYLQSLHLLADNGAVTLTADKTNAQYVYELAGKPYAQQFGSLTLNYEYIWYGEFDIDNAAFLKLGQQFKSFNNELKRS